MCYGTVYAQPQTARNIIQDCELISPGGEHFSWLYDNRARYGFTSAKRMNAYLQVEAAEPICGLYIQWKTPCPWKLQREEAGKWIDEGTYGENGMAQEYVAVGGWQRIRIVDQEQGKATLAISEMQVLGAGILPDDVHVWQTPPAKANLLILVAHPDDEWIFMGGCIPYYAVERGVNVMVVYLTYGDDLRRQELLNGLWAGGMRVYPELGPFADQFRTTANGIYILWGEETCKTYVANVFRKYRPDVVVTHDIEGEYGHGAHIVAAESALFAFDAAADDTYTTDEQPWQVSKLYLHLWPENQIRLDWNTPMLRFAGETPLTVASRAYACHISQQGGRCDYHGQTFWFKVHDGGLFDNALFGLARTVVGEDIQMNDFLENTTISVGE